MDTILIAAGVGVALAVIAIFEDKNSDDWDMAFGVEYDN